MTVEAVLRSTMGAWSDAWPACSGIGRRGTVEVPYRAVFSKGSVRIGSCVVRGVWSAGIAERGCPRGETAWLAIGRGEDGVERDEWLTTIGTARCGRCRCLQEGLRTSQSAVRVDEVANGVDGKGAVGGQETVVADLHEAMGQDVLEETADELQDIERGGPGAVAAMLAISKGDSAMFDREDAVVRDGDLEDVGRQVLQ